MRDLTKHDIAATQPVVRKGLSFEIADLILSKAWADFHNLRMVVRLDHGTHCEEYEEVIAFHARMDWPCQLIMWRSAKCAFVQPSIGRIHRYRSVAAVLESLTMKPRPILTDITAPTWPD
jgi:hypothetical protein